jgi:DNA polymerase
MKSNQTSDTFAEKKAALERIQIQVRDLVESPLYAYRKENNFRPVIGEGDPDAAIMFIGEAPGAEEAKTGRPFVGRAGKYLDTLIESIGIQRSDVYITNIVKDRPPKNRAPHKDEIRLYAPFLLEQIEIIQPEVIATLGRFSMTFILKAYDHSQAGETIGTLHGKLLRLEKGGDGVFLLPLYHPAATFYNPTLKPVLEEDVKVLEKFV